MKRGGPLKRYTPLRKVRLVAGKKKRKGVKVNYKKVLWRVFSEYIRRKNADHAGNVACVSCGATRHWKAIHAGHYIAKSLGLAIYFDEQNVAPQCPGCNMFRHGNLPQYALYLRKTYGEGILEALDERRRTTRKISEAEYLELIERYKSKLSDLDKREAA